jgi:hypothetical protein
MTILLPSVATAFWLTVFVVVCPNESVTVSWKVYWPAIGTVAVVRQEVWALKATAVGGESACQTQVTPGVFVREKDCEPSREMVVADR